MGSELIAHTSDRCTSSLSSQVWLRISAFLDLKSSNTQRTYLSIINEWCRFLGAEPGSPEATEFLVNATDLHAAAYRHWLERQPGQKPRHQSMVRSSERALSRYKQRERRDGLQTTLANATIAKKFAALRRLYRLLIATNLMNNHNPFDTDRVPAPKARSGQKRPTEMIDFDLVQKIISLPDASTPKGLRDHAALALLFGAGLRRSEVVALRLADLRHTPTGTPFIRLRSTKAGRDADQGLPSWAADAINTLAESRRVQGAQGGDFLFISYRGRGGKIATNHPLSDNGLYRLFKTYCQQAGAGSSATPHSARATAITKLLADGFGHREVQEFSRHSSVQMVELYDKRRLTVEQSPAKHIKY